MHICVEKKSFLHKENVWQGQALPGSVFTVGHTGSVLDDAWDLVQENIFPVGSSVLALSQSKGRGQTRRLWHSPVGNIYAALRLPLEGAFLSTAAAPALSAFIIKSLQRKGIFLHLKWPNDLVYVEQSPHKAFKVGGVLLEERQGVLMAGIGLNIVQAPDVGALREKHALPAGCLPMPTMDQHYIRLLNKSIFSSENPTAECLWLHLVSELDFWYKNKLPMNVTWKEDAEHVLLWKGHYVELDDGREKVYGILQGVGTLGEICIQQQGQMHLYTSGSLRLVQQGEM